MMQRILTEPANMYEIITWLLEPFTLFYLLFGGGCLTFGRKTAGETRPTDPLDSQFCRTFPGLLPDRGVFGHWIAGVALSP